MKSFLDRVFFTSSRYFRLKVATSCAVVRRAGGVDVVHQLNNYLNLAQTVIPPSRYWTMAYGREKGEVEGDGEGMQTLVKNAASMAWLLKSSRRVAHRTPAGERKTDYDELYPLKICRYKSPRSRVAFFDSESYILRVFHTVHKISDRISICVERRENLWDFYDSNKTKISFIRFQRKPSNPVL